MKICPKCGTPNQDKNYYCVECNAVMTGAKQVDDSEMLAKQMKNATKGETMKKWMPVIIMSFITIVIDVFMYYCIMTTEFETGSDPVLHRMLWQFLLYIPVAVLGLVNFDQIYYKTRLKKGLPEKHLPDWVNTGLIGLSLVCWFLVQSAIVGGVLFSK